MTETKLFNVTEPRQQVPLVYIQRRVDLFPAFFAARTQQLHQTLCNEAHHDLRVSNLSHRNIQGVSQTVQDTHRIIRMYCGFYQVSRFGRRLRGPYRVGITNFPHHHGIGIQTKGCRNRARPGPVDGIRVAFISSNGCLNGPGDQTFRRVLQGQQALTIAGGSEVHRTERSQGRTFAGTCRARQGYHPLRPGQHAANQRLLFREKAQLIQGRGILSFIR
ncbi:hypothetical protein D3C71_1217300 [compost metagenome]